jgi:RNA polymerase sigma-70 factor (ECF subfamily)
MGVAAADAEDLAQEVFLVMWRRRADWDAGRPLRPWLFGVALRIAHEHRHRRGREAPVGLVDQADERPRGEEQVAAATGMADYDDAHVLLKEELMPDGKTKLILREKASGKIVERVQ